jgi:hypothetical protein
MSAFVTSDDPNFMYRLGLVVLMKHQNLDVALELSRPYGAVIRNADIQKLSASTFHISVDLVAYL